MRFRSLSCATSSLPLEHGGTSDTHWKCITPGIMKKTIAQSDNDPAKFVSVLETEVRRRGMMNGR